MIKWIRAYNMEHPDDKVEFVGIDMQGVIQPLDSLFAFLKRTDPVMLIEVDQLLSGLKKDAGQAYRVSDSTKQAWVKAAQSSFDRISGEKQNWLSTAATHTDSMHIEWGIQYASLVKQFTIENINPMALYRDKAMAGNISWILSTHKPGTKMIVWAHDVHISRGEHPVTGLNYHRGISMGSWLAREYGTGYKAFGISTYSGEYRAYPGYTDYSKWISCPAFPGPAGSLDEALHRVAVQKRSAYLLLSLKDARQQEWLTAPLPTRFANHVSYEYAYWTRFSIPYQFDGIFFIDKTSAAKPFRQE
jgi:erythromycin esterase